MSESVDQIVADYEAERGDAPVNSMVEFAARLRGNLRLMARGALSAEDFNPDWRP